MIRHLPRIVLAILAVCAVSPGLPAYAQAPPAPKADTPPAATPAEATTKAPATDAKPRPVPAQRFAAPEEAVRALVAALRAGDTKQLRGILGSEGDRLISSGDPVVDRDNREIFLKGYDAGHRLETSGSTAVLHTGESGWPFPIPIVRDGERWRFDARQGREEILARSIGRNEIYTIQTCLAYVDAQREYYAADRDGDGILEYAQTFASATGKRDGLYWAARPGEPPSPFGDLVARARAAGYRRQQAGPTPYHGYLFRILTAQGPHAPGGAYPYIVRGQMLAGFALVAFPARYGVSGVMTFIVNHDGVVYQKDLGPRTPSLAQVMRSFDPDATWTKVDPAQVTLTRSP